jgi:hypothetical protein
LTGLDWKAEGQTCRRDGGAPRKMGSFFGRSAARPQESPVFMGKSKNDKWVRLVIFYIFWFQEPESQGNVGQGNKIHSFDKHSHDKSFCCGPDAGLAAADYRLFSSLAAFNHNILTSKNLR